MPSGAPFILILIWSFLFPGPDQNIEGMGGGDKELIEETLHSVCVFQVYAPILYINRLNPCELGKRSFLEC